jgi:lipoprotein-anchoring transpeptidase ErfK/SrfK
VAQGGLAGAVAWVAPIAMSWKPVSIGVGAVTALVVVFLVVVFATDAASKDQIADGIKVGKVDVGGLKTGAARDRVQGELATSVRRRVLVRYRSQQFVLRPETAQVRLDVNGTVDAARRKGRDGSNAFSRFLGSGDVDATIAPRVMYSRAAIRAFAGRVAKYVDTPAKDADIDIRNGKLSRQHARNGVSVQQPQLVAALSKRMTHPASTDAITIPVKVTERPDRTLDDLARRYPVVIAVNRDAKQLRLYKRLRLQHTYKIAVGKAGLETAAGRYKIQEKIVNPPWHVPNSAWAGDLAGKTIAPDDPQNPLEARWMGFHDGQGIHGTADLASLGTAASHGCIRMAVPDVEQLYAQVKVGTPVFMQ